MVRLLLLLPLIYAAAVADTSLAGAMAVGAVAPDFLALVAMYWLLAIARPDGFLAVGLAGLAQDLLAPGRIGLAAAAMLLVGCAAARLRARFGLEHFLWHAAMTGVAVTIAAILSAMGRWALGEVALSPLTLAARAAGVGLYTAGISAPWFLVAAWIREPISSRQRKTVGYASA